MLAARTTDVSAAAAASVAVVALAADAVSLFQPPPMTSPRLQMTSLRLTCPF